MDRHQVAKSQLTQIFDNITGQLPAVTWQATQIHTNEEVPSSITNLKVKMLRSYVYFMSIEPNVNEGNTTAQHFDVFPCPGTVTSIDGLIPVSAARRIQDLTSSSKKGCTSDNEQKYPTPDKSEAERTKRKANKSKAVSRFNTELRQQDGDEVSTVREFKHGRKAGNLGTKRRR